MALFRSYSIYFWLLVLLLELILLIRSKQNKRRLIESGLLFLATVLFLLFLYVPRKMELPAVEDNTRLYVVIHGNEYTPSPEQADTLYRFLEDNARTSYISFFDIPLSLPPDVKHAYGDIWLYEDTDIRYQGYHIQLYSDSSSQPYLCTIEKVPVSGSVRNHKRFLVDSAWIADWLSDLQNNP